MKIRLVIIEGPNKGAFYPLRQGENILGRGEDVQVMLNDAQVSTKHCTIFLDGNKISIQDEKSSNGTFVNGKIIKSTELRGDEKVSIGPFSFMLGAEKGSQQVMQVQENGKSPPGTDIAFSASAKPVKTKASSEKALYKKMFNKFNEVVLPVLYDFNKKNEWWTIVITLFLSYVVLNIALSVYPIVESAKESVIREAERRAAYIARQVAELNQEYIANRQQEQYLDTSFAKKDRSVEEALIVSLEGRILAPGFRLNEISTNPFIIRTLKEIKSGDQKHWNLKKSRNTEKTKAIVSVPIFVRSEKSGLNTPKAIAVVKFSLSGIALDLGTIAVIYFEALITALILGIVCIYLISKLTYKPITSINDDLDKVLRGIETNVAKTYKFEPLNELIDSINSALGRIPDLVGDNKKEAKTTDNEHQIIESMLLTIENMVIHSPRPMMLLTASSEIIAMSLAFEELSGIHLSASQNQKITEVARDEAFVAMMEDMLRDAPERGFGGVTEEYEFPSGNYSLHCVVIQSMPEKIEAFLITTTNSDEDKGIAEYA